MGVDYGVPGLWRFQVSAGPNPGLAAGADLSWAGLASVGFAARFGPGLTDYSFELSDTRLSSVVEDFRGEAAAFGIEGCLSLRVGFVTGGGFRWPFYIAMACRLRRFRRGLRGF